MEMPNSKKEAREKGSPLFFTGKECKRGHIDNRRASNGNCVACDAHNNKANYGASSGYHRARSAAWRADNPEKVKAQIARKTERLQSSPELRQKVRDRQRERYETDDQYRAKTLAMNSIYRHRERQKINERNRAKRAANPKLFRAMERKRYAMNPMAKLASSARWKNRNEEKVRQFKSLWHQGNKEKAKASRWRRKARIKQVGGTFTGHDIQRLYENQKGKCASCCASIKSGYEIDHVYPIALGGSNWPDNLQLLCAPCNRAKSYKDPLVWAKENGRLL